jgi:phosphopantetheinyl transferase
MVPELLELIAPERRKKVLERTQVKDQNLALLAGLMLREVLGAVSDNDLEIEPLGRPRLTGNGPNFSLSHSGPYVALSVGTPVHGLDIQELRTKPLPERLTHWTMTPEEQSFFEKDPDLLLFIKIWTMKEAYIKATGQGLAQGLNTFTVFPFESGPRSIGDRTVFFHLSAPKGAVMSLASLSVSFPPVIINLNQRLSHLIETVTKNRNYKPVLSPLYRYKTI